MKWLRLIVCELRSTWLLTVLACVIYAVVQLCNPSLALWCILAYAFSFFGVVIKVRQCQKDTHHKNMLMFYGLTPNRKGLLFCRVVAGILTAWTCYAVQMVVMHFGNQFTREVLTEAEWTLFRNNFYLIQFAVYRTGMFSLELSVVLRMLLTLALFTLLVELVFVARDTFVFAYGLIIVLFMIFRCLFLRLPEGATLYLFLVTRLPAIYDMIFYALCFLVCFLFLRPFEKGMEEGQESYVDTTGHEVA